ncbi:Thiamine phosphate synthase [Hyphomicrobium sp. 1Nfss2.1]|uniref:thiamine phosphate synthase n=1 Tax=Hyphomicrobium sp. 1Nfss2.1 TaxID=3413936 RepID=UPI003C79DCD2
MLQEFRSRLYVVATVGADLARLAATLEAAQAATLLVMADASTPLTATSARPLIELAQSKDIAALIYGDAQLARTLRADGVHVAWGKDVVAQYAEAREVLGNRYIVGVDVGRTRHDAMDLAEAGADYIGFGIPAHVEDRAAAAARRRELVGWWSEIFEVPCVAFDVESADEAIALASVGADFIAMRADFDLSSPATEQLAHDIAAASPQPEATA